MHASLLLSAALVTPAAPLPRDTDTSAGPPPRVVAVKGDAFGNVRITGYIPTKVTVTSTQFVLEMVMENGKQVQKQVQKQVEYDTVTTQHFSKTLGEFDGKFSTADGAPLTPDEATARVKGGATLLASSDGKPVAKAWLRAVSGDTVVMAGEALAHAQFNWGGEPLPTTPAPRLARLATDATGKPVAPTVPVPANNGYVNYDNFDGRMALRGGRVRAWDGEYYGNNPVPAPVTLKPLADVKFDAYDVTGKLIGRTDVLKRLAAGGTVLVAGDSRMPDAAYLSAFKDDVIVLTGAELVLPIPPVDQTKKKLEEKPAAEQPAIAGKAQVLVPAVQRK